MGGWWKSAPLLALAIAIANAVVGLDLHCPAKPHVVVRTPDDENASYRLPRDVLPEHYDLTIITNVGDNGLFNFSGKVDIKLAVAKNTSQIRLHARELDLLPAQLVELPKGRPVAVTKQILQSDDEQVLLELGESLRAGQSYALSIRFHANLSIDLHGFYRSSYYDKETNESRWLAVSHFEPTHAREAFPCFDEPAMKATFTISMGHKSTLHALSNMPAEKSEPLSEFPGYTLTRFYKTVPMSTYLVAFVISDFEGRLSEKREGEAQVGIWARRDAIHQVDYAREISPKALRFFEEYFNQKYPLPKQDMVAIPDFSAGAMENWGLITYREAQLLFDSEVSSQASKGHLADTVVHELAHQWFGNLVTMKWWSDLWLNEGFATYMATLGTSNLHPDWQWMDEKAVDQALIVLPLDALASTHSVVRPIGHPKQISQSFDAITYKKGSALLRMMHSFLGEEAFRQGLADYIEKYKYKNADQDDLWAALTAEAHKQGTLPLCLTAKLVMDTWTVQDGYPLISVVRNYERDSAFVHQERYLSDSRQRSGSACWYVPLSYTTQEELNFKDVTPKEWLLCDSQQHNISNIAPKDKWVIFNIGITGLYRVQYDARNWELLTAALADKKHRDDIGVLNRVQLIIDAFDLAKSGRLPYSVALKLAGTMTLERDHFPWRATLGALGSIDKVAIRDTRYHIFRDWVRHLLSGVADDLGALRDTPTGFQVRKQKSLISSWACKFEVGDCVEQARELFAEWRSLPEPDTKNPIPRDIRTLVYCVAIKHGSAKDWNWLWHRYLRSNVASERVTILSALGCSRDLWQLRRYLEWGITEKSGVRLQDSSYVFSAVARSESGYYIAKSFLFERIADIIKHYGNPATSRIGRYVTDIAHFISTEEEYAQLLNFTKKSEEYLTGADQTVRQSLESASINTQWRKDHLDQVLAAISETGVKEDSFY